MRTQVDDLLRTEAERYKLRFTCEDCAHFSPEARACAHGYPTEAHQGIRLDAATALEFCKEFELV